MVKTYDEVLQHTTHTQDAAADALLTALRVIEDPWIRWHALSTAQARHERLAVDLGRMARGIAWELRTAGMSIRGIARHLGVSPTRVQQLLEPDHRTE